MLVVACLMVRFGSGFCILNILLYSDVCVKFYSVRISSSAGRNYFLCTPPHLSSVWRRLYGLYGLGVSEPEVLIYCDNKTRKLSRFLCIMGIHFKLIIGKLKLHLFCKCILSLNTLKAVCVTASIYEIKLRHKCLNTDF